MKKQFTAMISVLMITSALTACGTSSDTKGKNSTPVNTASPSSVDTSPVTLSIYMDTGETDTFIQENMVKPVQQKFPYITLNVVNRGTGTQPEDLVASNNVPDLIYFSSAFLGRWKQLGLTYDLNDLIKKNNFDVSLYDKVVLDQLRMSGDKSGLYGLPFYINYTVLYYNKDIFDKFGVAYPKDNMTWDQVIELGKKMSRTDGGIAYQGLSLPSAQDLATQLSLPLVDPITNKSQLNAANSADGYKKVMQLVMDYNKSGAKNPGWVSDNNARWTTVAMYPNWSDDLKRYVEFAKSGQVYNWDMVSYPVFSDSSGYARRVNSHDFLISSTSKNKDAAFKVLAYLMSKEYQTKLFRAGNLTALTDPSLQKDFAVDVPELKGKNLQAIFKVKAAPFVHTLYDSFATQALSKYTDKAVKGEIDINTALKMADEEANAAIQNELTKGK